MLSLEAVYKSYEDQPLLRGVSFSVAQAETVCLLGPSGSGKSTLLRIIAGLEKAEAGRVLWDGQDQALVPVHKRGFGLMFQEYALFPHRNVAQNVAFGLRMQGLPRPEIERRVADALRQVNLEAFAQRQVTDLSGGEQQRVALARALAPRPRLLMLDEPLGALDRALREQLHGELRRLLHASAIPAIYVTHDQEEAFAIADRLILLHEGRIVQQGAPQQVYNRPAGPWVARFLGLDNLLAGQVLAGSALRIKTELGVFAPGALSGREPAPGDSVQVLIRPGAFRLAASEDHNIVEGIVCDAVFSGQAFRVELQSGHSTLHLSLPELPPVGQSLRLYIPPEGILFFNGSTLEL